MSINFNQLSNAVRFLSIDAVQKANSGHPGMPMGMADVATTLFKYHLRFNPKNPDWINRDRFILSAGHGSMLLYSLLYLTGYKSISIDDIKNFRQLNSICAGHPEYKSGTGIETTTGPLGQGLGNGVGMAIAEEILRKKLGSIEKASKSKKPTVISCKTVIGFGSPNKSGKASSHGSPLGDEEISLVRKKLKWKSQPFEIPQEILNEWRKIGSKGEQLENNWLQIIKKKKSKH